jgi:hypothetical protein
MENRYSFLSIVDNGTTFHMVVLVRTGGGTPSSLKCWDKFVQHWVSWAGLPKVVTVDRGSHNRGAFAANLSAAGVYIRQAGLESPEQIGRGERHGGMFKKSFKRVIHDNHVVGKREMSIAAMETLVTKNEFVKKGGFSPSQWVLGKLPRGVGQYLDEEEIGHLGKL